MSACEQRDEWLSELAELLELLEPNSGYASGAPASDNVRIEVIQEIVMHYRNGRVAQNGDVIVKLGDRGNIVSFGVVHNTVHDNDHDYCIGQIAVIQSVTAIARLVDCLHVEDVAELLREKGLGNRPSGK